MPHLPVTNCLIAARLKLITYAPAGQPTPTTLLPARYRSLLNDSTSKSVNAPTIAGSIAVPASSQMVPGRLGSRREYTTRPFGPTPVTNRCS